MLTRIDTSEIVLKVKLPKDRLVFGFNSEKNSELFFFKQTMKKKGPLFV